MDTDAIREQLELDEQQFACIQSVGQIGEGLIALAELSDEQLAGLEPWISKLPRAQIARLLGLIPDELDRDVWRL